MDQYKLTQKLKELGFIFKQGEKCTKGKFFVCLDCEPYLAQIGNEKTLWFKTWKEFLKFYNDNL